jgi:nitrate/nitrite transporter NarK
MIPAEVFPTRYRAFCHGLSAGAGKLGSILVQLLSAYYNIGSTGTDDHQTQRYGWILVVFSAAMIVGAAVTHFFIPPTQRQPRRRQQQQQRHCSCSVTSFWNGEKEKTLETLALGRLGESSRYAVRRTRSVHRVNVRAYEG